MKSNFKIQAFRSTNTIITKDDPDFYKLPHQVVVYPNNEVSVDGEFTLWSEAEFAALSISMERPIYHGRLADRAEHRINKDTHLMIFPTVFIDQSFKRRINPFKFKRKRYGQSSGNRHRNCVPAT